ncbi:MAG: S9 family peptidase, partial [Candidatus Thorarchaeota archaeon]
MKGPRTAGYGSWKSPINSDVVASGTIRLDGQIEIEDNQIYWVEMHPTEAGRYVVVRCLPDGQSNDITPEPY